jgi:hypothetical protein
MRIYSDPLREVATSLFRVAEVEQYLAMSRACLLQQERH